MKSRLASALFLSLGLFCISSHAEEGFEPPVPVRTVAPRYPDELRRDGTAGIVQLSVMIDESGNVNDPKVEKTSNDAFVNPAIDAIKRWKFKPAKRGGEIVSIRVSIPIRFLVNN